MKKVLLFCVFILILSGCVSATKVGDNWVCPSHYILINHDGVWDCVYDGAEGQDSQDSPAPEPAPAPEPEPEPEQEQEREPGPTCET